MYFRFELWHLGQAVQVFKTEDYHKARRFFECYFWDMGFYTKTYIDGKYYKMEEAKKHFKIRKKTK